MPSTEVVFYRDDDGTVPVLDWLGGLSLKARLKCLVRIERLRELGYRLRRPEAGLLRDGVYELRVSLNCKPSTHRRTLSVCHPSTNRPD